MSMPCIKPIAKVSVLIMSQVYAHVGSKLKIGLYRIHYLVIRWNYIGEDMKYTA